LIMGNFARFRIPLPVEIKPFVNGLSRNRLVRACLNWHAGQGKLANL
jgi:hypothetical protein